MSTLSNLKNLATKYKSKPHVGDVYRNHSHFYQVFHNARDQRGTEIVVYRQLFDSYEYLTLPLSLFQQRFRLVKEVHTPREWDSAPSVKEVITITKPAPPPSRPESLPTTATPAYYLTSDNVHLSTIDAVRLYFHNSCISRACLSDYGVTYHPAVRFIYNGKPYSTLTDIRKANPSLPARLTSKNAYSHGITVLP